MSNRPVIVGIGSRTPLGLHSQSSAAALRAGISAMAEIPFLRDKLGQPMPAAIDAVLEPTMWGPDRLQALGASALLEACSPLHGITRKGVKIPMFLALPELRPGFSHEDAQAIEKGLGKDLGLPFALSPICMFPEGHAAGALALGTAVEELQRGGCEMALVGGLESYLQPETLEWLDANRQLAGADSRSSFVPGEAAGFCLLATDSACEALQSPPLARVCSASTGREDKVIKTDGICLGEGLTNTVRDAISGLPPGEKINAVICDVNGERYRGEEWGFVCLRLSRYFDDPTAYLSPADSWGDTGAASIPLYAMLACQAAQRGYSKGPRTLLWASSEHGLRGAVVIEAL